VRPPESMPEAMRAAFTMDGRIPVEAAYRDDTRSEPLVLTEAAVDAEAAKVRAGGSVGYAYTTQELRQAFGRWPIQGKRVALVGCVRPDYPGMCLAYGAASMTIFDRNRIVSNHPKIWSFVPDQWDGELFDAVVSLSMVDHDGLGRYGDPIDPEADVKAMAWFRDILKPNGLLYFAVAVRTDCVIWNKGRVYGKLRMPLLLEGWDVLFAPSAYQRMDFPNRTVIALLVLKEER